MSFTRAIFAFVLLTPVIGLMGSKYFVTALLAREPEPIVLGPQTSTASTSTATRAPVTPTSTPTVSSTATPRATATRIAVATATPRSTAGLRPSAAAHQRPRMRRRRAARPTATPRPTVSPTVGIVTLDRYWIGSTSARRGTVISVGYVIDNGTGRTQRIMLGASIKSSRAAGWLSAVISDPPHDVIAVVPPGLSTHTRFFTLSGALRAGRYDVAWGLRDAVTGQGDAVVAAPGALQVLP